MVFHPILDRIWPALAERRRVIWGSTESTLPAVQESAGGPLLKSPQKGDFFSPAAQIPYPHNPTLALE